MGNLSCTERTGRCRLSVGQWVHSRVSGCPVNCEKSPLARTANWRCSFLIINLARDVVIPRPAPDIRGQVVSPAPVSYDLPRRCVRHNPVGRR